MIGVTDDEGTGDFWLDTFLRRCFPTRPRNYGYPTPLIPLEAILLLNHCTADRFL